MMAVLWVVRPDDGLICLKTADDYERLSLNMSELFRYLSQQKSLVKFYEKNTPQ